MSRRPWFVIAAWVVVAVAVIVTAPGLETTSDEAEFLPDHYESIQAAELQSEKFSDNATPAALPGVRARGRRRADRRRPGRGHPDRRGARPAARRGDVRAAGADGRPAGPAERVRGRPGADRHHRAGRGGHRLRPDGLRGRRGPARLPRRAQRRHRPLRAGHRLRPPGSRLAGVERAEPSPSSASRRSC
ncbi:hypothetical protein [Nocardioides sp. TF02-7]|uniref:hypothetical protein n=1 Tax=Nocardioides sp. TF02-7 TaxID=2917724 RepID=UPI001F05F718|nr:hypothetical protein [Nocardioides sp. TF02-7]UMG93387.1 hypothetical protein MF408_03795 [Nocardioides sp. TF02-7]